MTGLWINSGRISQTGICLPSGVNEGVFIAARFYAGNWYISCYFLSNTSYHVSDIGNKMAKPLMSEASLLKYPVAQPVCPTASMVSPVKVGVIGCGCVGSKFIRTLLSAQGCEVVGIADHDPRQLEKTTIGYPSSLGTIDYRRLLDDPEIEAVVITTPMATHFNIAWDALNAGKHVLIEKLLTDSVREAEQLMALADKRGCVLMVDNAYLFTGTVQKMCEVMRSEELGDVVYFESTRVDPGLIHHDENVIWDLVPYDLAILLHLLDKNPMAVSAVGTADAESGQGILAYLTLSFDDNTLAHFHVNRLAPRKIRQITIGGDRKTMVFDDRGMTDSIKIYDIGCGVERGDSTGFYQTPRNPSVVDILTPQLNFDKALAEECEYFSKCIREKKTPHNDGYFGLEVVRILHAATQSMYENGKRVYIE